jgi:hypothetical protein
MAVLPQELLSLQDVEVLWSNQELANKFEKLQMQVGFKLLIDPPLDANFYKQTTA